MGTEKRGKRREKGKKGGKEEGRRGEKKGKRKEEGERERKERESTKNKGKERDEKEGKWGQLLVLPPPSPLATGPCYAPGADPFRARACYRPIIIPAVRAGLLEFEVEFEDISACCFQFLGL